LRKKETELLPDPLFLEEKQSSSIAGKQKGSNFRHTWNFLSSRFKSFSFFSSSQVTRDSRSYRALRASSHHHHFPERERYGEREREGEREFVNLWTQNLWERKLGPEVFFPRQFERI
jgi:hypothetical protein